MAPVTAASMSADVTDVMGEPNVAVSVTLAKVVTSPLRSSSLHDRVTDGEYERPIATAAALGGEIEPADSTMLTDSDANRIAT